jgi:hypothetical protein
MAEISGGTGLMAKTKFDAIVVRPGCAGNESPSGLLFDQSAGVYDRHAPMAANVPSFVQARLIGLPVLLAHRLFLLVRRRRFVGHACRGRPPHSFAAGES